MIGEAKPFLILKISISVSECFYGGYKRHYYFAIVSQNHFHWSLRITLSALLCNLFIILLDVLEQNIQTRGQ